MHARLWRKLISVALLSEMHIVRHTSAVPFIARPIFSKILTIDTL